MSGSDDRLRRRQGTARIVDGVPYSNRDSTLSLLPGAVTGRWVASNAHLVRGTLLDLGAGNQPFRPWYTPLAERIVAVDATPLPGLDVVALASPLPFADESFDTVLCTSVLEHTYSAETAAGEIARVLRPGGHVLLTVPFFYPEHEAPYDFWRVTHRGMRLLLERNGLVVDNLAAQGGPFLMLAHFAVLTVVNGLRFAARKLGPLGHLLDNRFVELLIAAPQEAVRARLSYRLSPLSKIVSLGYMAAAHKPAAEIPG